MWKPASPSHFAAIVEMCRDLNREDPGPRPVPEAHTKATLQALASQPARGKAVVLEIDDKIGGYALLISFWSNELGGDICNVDEIYVRPAFRGRGFATQLVAGLKQGSSVWPEKPVAIQLEVSPKNPRARALYEKLGFEPLRNSVMRFWPK